MPVERKIRIEPEPGSHSTLEHVRITRMIAKMCEVVSISDNEDVATQICEVRSISTELRTSFLVTFLSDPFSAV